MKFSLNYGTSEETLLEGKCFPHIGCIETEKSIGTGFVVKERMVITAWHVVAGAKKIRFLFRDQEYTAQIKKEYESYDMALLEVNSDLEPPLCPLPLAYLPDPPMPPLKYITWGYRKVGTYRPLYGRGTIVAHLEKGMLQLETTSQRDGMSGCPIATSFNGKWRIVAMGFAQYRPNDARDQEPTAFAYQFPFKPLPPELVDLCKQSLSDEPNVIWKMISEIYRSQLEIQKRVVRADRAKWLCTGLALLIIVFFLFENRLVVITNSFLMFCILIVGILSYITSYAILKANKNKHKLGEELITLLTASDPYKPVEDAIKRRWEKYKSM